MMSTRKQITIRHWGGSLIALALSGCSGFGGNLLENRQQITIDSDPQRATVFAEGVNIGMTPLVIKPNEVFQARFTGGDTETGGLFVYRYVGTLAVKKPGCKPYITQVNDNILSRDIHVKLECDPDYQAVEAQPTVPQPAAVPSAEPAPSSAGPKAVQPTGSAEERLQRIENLYNKGLLRDGEYRTLRQRVLDTL